MVIGITGSSGAGKSTVCEILEKKYDSKTITADKIARELSKKGTEYLNEIVEKFGNEILLENGELNRKKLANIIYSNQNERDNLNQITFKYIKNEIKKQIEQSDKKIIAIDAPLLLEAKMKNLCDYTIAIVSENKELQIDRIVKRDNIDRQHAIARLNAQHPNDFYIAECDYTIINNDLLENQIDMLMNVIKQ